MIDKSQLLDDLRARIAADLEALERRQRDAQAGSTHEESRSEHAKDTRATEQSYLARGLAERVEVLRRTMTVLASFVPRSFGECDPIAVGALVSLAVDRDEAGARGDADAAGGEQCWWLVPTSGGIELHAAGRLVRTLTGASPLGRALLGLQTGDEGAYATPRGERRFIVREVG